MEVISLSLATIPLPCEISAAALQEVKNIMKNKNIPDGYGLRLGIKGGGCGTMGFLIGFDKPKEGDNLFMVEEVSIVIEKRHIMYLVGVLLDFEDTEEARGFVFLTGKE